jgi:beta-xylosidase
MVASTFHFMPGVPVLHSRDLVNWQVIAHVFPRLDIDPRYSMQGGNRYGRGAWAPAIRFRKGKYYVYFPTPDEGIFMSTAPSPRGPWTAPVAVIASPNLEDPCPFWDDDGNAYLIHSRTGAGPLILHRMSADGKSVLDDGKVIVQNPEKLPTLEGPKLYKRNGYYYIFAPYGGVGKGAQAVLRSKNIYGPYEFRTVLAQGSTSINGPHQGGYIETPDGKGWFLHFQSRGAYGRINHLQPVRWSDDWPVIGDSTGASTTGSPVSEWVKPVASARPNPQYPLTSDDFTSSRLSLQWEWNHNPDDAHWSLTEHPGFLRLKAMPASDLLHARNTITEVPQDSAFEFNVKLDVSGMADGQHAGLAMFSNKPSWIGVIQSGGVRRLTFGSSQTETPGPALTGNQLQLRIQVQDEMATCAYSLDDGSSFHNLGQPEPIYFSWWKGARPAIFTFNTQSTSEDAGHIDIDWAHYDRKPN